MDLPRCHVAASFSATPSIFTAGRTIILPSERPELRSDRSGASAWLVSSFLAASNVAAAAFVRIWRFIHPCKFGADLVDGGISARHRLSNGMSLSAPMLRGVLFPPFASLKEQLSGDLHSVVKKVEFGVMP